MKTKTSFSANLKLYLQLKTKTTPAASARYVLWSDIAMLQDFIIKIIITTIMLESFCDLNAETDCWPF